MSLFPQESLVLLRRREPQFLKSIFQENNPILLRVLAANGFYGETAEDLVQQTWERFFANLEKFEGRSALLTFLCGILINKIREHRRVSARLIFEEDADAVMARAFTSDGWWSRPPADPSELLHSNQLSGFISECLEGLTEAQKTAFVLKEVDGDESTEICNVLGVSVSHLRVLIFRAKDKLRQCLAGKVVESK